MRRFTPLPVTTLLILATAVAACSSTSSGPTGVSAPFAIGLLGGNVQVMPVGSVLSLPLLIHVTDQYGLGFAGAGVTFAATGGASTSATTVTTDASGNASVGATLGFAAGVDSITASVAGVALPARFFETALAGPPAVDSIVSGNQQTGTTGSVLPFSLAVIVLDSHGNGVAGNTVAWSSLTGTLSSATSVTDATGKASINFTPGLGANVVTATIGGSSLIATFTETGN